ncbi:glycosyltransferase family 4 protein [Haloarcula amylolytica]|uniref:glycosyltransferase family 4 protein n=1 Tax=Haloarcula amylolytica TaxID=396317 RepID=UPI003C70E7F2
MTKIALIKGQNLRDDGNVLVWEELNRNSKYDVVAFGSDPSRYDTSGIDLPIRKFPWVDGKYDLFDYDHFGFAALRKARLPAGYLYGISSLVEEFDVLHANENFNAFSIQAALAARNEDVKFTFTAGENIPYPRFQHNPILWWLKKFVNSTADGITTTTKAGKRALIHEGVTFEKIDVIPNTIPIDKFQPNIKNTPTEYNLPTATTNETTILFVHRPSEQKGTPYLLEAFFNIQDKYNKTRLILVGENMMGENLTERIKQNDQINWLERIPHEQMPGLYAISDIFILPSVTMTNNEEQFGMGLLEAMACGLPAVVTDVGGIPHVTEPGETALVIDERSSDDLADALERLITNPELRTDLGQAGRQRVEATFAPSKVASELESFYDEVLYQDG